MREQNTNNTVILLIDNLLDGVGAFLVKKFVLSCHHVLSCAYGHISLHLEWKMTLHSRDFILCTNRSCYCHRCCFIFLIRSNYEITVNNRFVYRHHNSITADFHGSVNIKSQCTKSLNLFLFMEFD